MRGLIAIINIFVQQRWSMRVNGGKLFRDKGSVENCNGLIRNLGPIFTEVDFPCLRGPAQFVFDHMIVQIGSTEGKAGVDTDGVSPDVGDIDAIEVRIVRIQSYGGLSKGSGDFDISQEATVRLGCRAPTENRDQWVV